MAIRYKSTQFVLHGARHRVHPFVLRYMSRGKMGLFIFYGLFLLSTLSSARVIGSRGGEQCVINNQNIVTKVLA